MVKWTSADCSPYSALEISRKLESYFNQNLQQVESWLCCYADVTRAVQQSKEHSFQCCLMQWSWVLGQEVNWRGNEYNAECCFVFVTRDWAIKILAVEHTHYMPQIESISVGNAAGCLNLFFLSISGKYVIHLCDSSSFMLPVVTVIKNDVSLLGGGSFGCFFFL